MNPNLMRPARQDGRPLYFRTGGAGECFQCLRAGLTIHHPAASLVFNDPANSPGEPGSIHTICRHHLPPNAVIFDPASKLCFDVNGDPVES